MIFAQRRVGDAWERQIEAERTKVEPEREPEVWARLGMQPDLRLDAPN